MERLQCLGVCEDAVMLWLNLVLMCLVISGVMFASLENIIISVHNFIYSVMSYEPLRYNTAQVCAT